MGLQWNRAFMLVRQTSNYLWYRAMIHSGLILVVLAYLLGLSVVGAIFGIGAFWILLGLTAIFSVMISLISFVGEALFYRQRAGHIALTTEILSEGKLPDAISQVKWAQGRVRHYYGMTMLPQVRAGLREAIRTVNDRVFDSAEIIPTPVLPLPGLEGGTRLAQHLVTLSQGYLEDAAIAHAFKTKNENVFDAARTAVLLYCQCWKPILTDAVTLTLLGYAFTLCASILFLIPLGLIAHFWVVDTDTTIHFVLFAAGVLLGLTAKWVLFDPVASAAMVFTFLEEADLVVVDEAWDEVLEDASPAYALMKEKALHDIPPTAKPLPKRSRAKRADQPVPPPQEETSNLTTEPESESKPETDPMNN